MTADELLYCYELVDAKHVPSSQLLADCLRPETAPATLLSALRLALRADYSPELTHALIRVLQARNEWADSQVRGLQCFRRKTCHSQKPFSLTVRQLIGQCKHSKPPYRPPSTLLASLHTTE